MNKEFPEKSLLSSPKPLTTHKLKVIYEHTICPKLLRPLKSSRLKFEAFDTYLELYSKIDYCKFNWHLSDDENTKEEILKIDYVQKLIENEGFELEAILKYITCGGLNIPSFGNATNFEKNKTSGYYLTLQQLGLDPNSYIPVDFHCPASFISYTACLKIEDNKLIDNILLISYQGEEILDMGIGLSEYIDLAHDCKAVYMWQIDFLNRNNKKESILHNALEQIFPSENLNLSKWK